MITDDADMEELEDAVFTLRNVSGGERAELGSSTVFTLFIKDNDAVGIDEELANSLEVFPNPASNLVFVKLPEGIAPEQANHKLFTLSGKLVQQGDFMQRTTAVDVSALPNGVYLLHVVVADRYAVLRVMVQH